MSYLYFLTSIRDLDDAYAEAYDKCEEWHSEEAPYSLVLAINDRGERATIYADKEEALQVLPSVKTMEDAHKLAWEETLKYIFYYNPKLYNTVRERLKDSPLESWSRKLIVILADLVQDMYSDLLPKLLTCDQVISEERVSYVLALEVLLDIQASKGVAPFTRHDYRPFPLFPFNWPCYDLRISPEEKERSIVIMEEVA